MEQPLERAKLILASASPRRRELLAAFDIPFAVVPSLADEAAIGAGKARVAALARLKGSDVFAAHPSLPVLSADTLVCVENRVLGKPTDERSACAMLRLLSARTHEVHTGVCLRLPNGRMLEAVDTTLVTFRALSDAEILRYVRTGEPMDKAGAYAIQGRGGAFIERIEGSPTNVIGLPLCAVDRLLKSAGLLPENDL